MEKETSIALNGDFKRYEQGIQLKAAFMRALALDTKLPLVIRLMPGMSGKKYRYLINNLVETTKDARYLEVGTWTGSTACSALYGNVAKAVCIDNWSEFDGPRDTFLQNMDFIKNTAKMEFTFIESDFRQVDYSAIGKFNIFLFDGPHFEGDHYDSVFLTKPALDDVYTYIIDDWNWEWVRRGTNNAIQKNNIEVICSIEIRTTQDDSHPEISRQQSDWHNGYFIAVCKKV